MSQSEIQEVMVSLEEVQEQIAMGKALEELTKNPLFDKVITQAYFKQEAIQLVGMKAHPTNEQTAKSIENKMIGISALQSFFNSVYRKGMEAQAALDDHEQALTEMAAEE